VVVVVSLVWLLIAMKLVVVILLEMVPVVSLVVEKLNAVVPL
jgi:hypothetical protein